MDFQEYCQTFNIQILDRHGGKGTLTLGNGWSISPNVSFDTTDSIIIGENVIISEDVKIFTHDHLVSSPREIRHSPLVIGDNVFIGEGTRIYEGCNHIGDGAFIAGCSVVTKDVPENELWAGVNARFIRKIERET